MAGKIKGIIVEIGGDTSALQKSLKDVNSKSSSLSKELRGINTLLKLDPKNTEILAQKQKVLNGALEENNKKLKELKYIEEEAIKKGINTKEEQQENWRTLQREIASTQNKIKNITNELGNLNKESVNIEKIGKNFEKVGEKIDKVGSKITAGVTAPLVAVSGVGIKSAMDFETAFTGVEKTVDGTTEQLEELKNGIKKLSKEIPSSTTEISAVAEAAGQLGIKTEDVLSFTKVMIDLGNSTNLSAEEAASALAKFANVTKMPAKDYDKLGSVIVALGNNFATTESDIVSMSTRLASTGELTGLTQSQIMALATAMSSVGIEAEAGGSAMSKLLKQIQLATELGGEDLEEFANVAGMTSSEFKQAFEKDAVKALSSFIGGLNDTERNGKSAIAILDDMGLTEVRLSNTVLSLANASDVMNNAVDLASEAWEENTALTKEADKRYATLESRFKTTLNKANNLSISFGEKLTPSINKIMDKADKFIDILENLDEKQLNNIIKIGGMVAAIGPLTKIVGKGTTAVGKISNGFEIFSKALKVSKGEATSNEKSINSLSKAISFLKSPTGVAIGAVTATAAAIALLTKKTKDEMAVIDEANKKINDSVTARNNTLDSIKNNMNANLAEIDNVKVLNSELKVLVDENGKVKDGYKDRANFILSELNKALGTEYSLNGDIIDSYKEMQKQIEATIKKKEAQLILEANEEEYKEAIKNKTDALKERAETYSKILELRKKIQDSEDNKNGIMDLGVFERNSMIDEYNELVKTYDDLGTQLESYNGNIEKYQTNQELFLTGTDEAYQKIADSVSRTNSSINSNVSGSLAERLQLQAEALEKDKEILAQEEETNKNAKDSIYAKNVEESQKNLELTKNTLIEMTGTAENMSPEVEEAWKTLATNSSTEYNDALSKLPTETQEKIKGIVGTIDEDKTVSKSAGTLGDNLANAFFSGVAAKELGKNVINGLKKGFEDAETQGGLMGSIGGIGNKILGKFKSVLGIASPSKKTKQDGIYLLQGMSKGIIEGTPDAIKNAKIASNKILNSFDGKFNISNNLLKDIPNLQNSLHASLNASINPNIFKPNIVINTQRLDTQELDRIVNYVNNRFGKSF